MNRSAIAMAVCLLLSTSLARAGDTQTRLAAKATRNGEMIDISARLVSGAGADAQVVAAPRLTIEPGRVGWVAIGTGPAGSDDTEEPMSDGIHIDAISVAGEMKVLVVARKVEGGLVVFAQAVEVPIEPAP